MNVRKLLYSSVFFLIFLGIIIEPNITLIENLGVLVQGRAGLLVDAFAKAGLGAAFVNAGLVGLISAIILDLTKSDFDGNNFGAAMFTVSFAFFGKNILNVWPILLGGLLYPVIFKKDVRDTISTTLYATSLAPFISEALFVFDIPAITRIPLALFFGISMGLIVHMLSPHVRQLHKNYSLYNTGVAVGIIGTVYVAILRSYGFTIESVSVWDLDKHIGLYIIFGLLFAGILVYGLIKDKGIKKYLELAKTSAKGQDYFEDYDMSTVFINGGTLGLFTLAVIFILDAPLNGPILGGVIGIVSFMGSGKHVKNIAPIFLGVILASLGSTWSMSTPSIILMMLFLTGLAPIAGEFGFVPAVIAAFINASVTQNTGDLHGGLVLYNTGYSIGITCAFIIPIFETLLPHKVKKETV